MNDPATPAAEHPARKYFLTVAALDAVRVGLLVFQWMQLNLRVEEAPILRLVTRLNIYGIVFFAALAWGTFRLHNWARIAQFVFYPMHLIAAASLLGGEPPFLEKLIQIPILVLVPQWFPLRKCGALFGKPEAERPAPDSAAKPGPGPGAQP